MNEMIYITKDGVSVKDMKKFLNEIDDDVKITIAEKKDGILYSSNITEIIFRKNEYGVEMMSQLTRDIIDNE